MCSIHPHPGADTRITHGSGWLLREYRSHSRRDFINPSRRTSSELLPCLDSETELLTCSSQTGPRVPSWSLWAEHKRPQHCCELRLVVMFSGTRPCFHNNVCSLCYIAPASPMCHWCWTRHEEPPLCLYSPLTVLLCYGSLYSDTRL